VIHADLLKRTNIYGFKRNTFAFPELDAINEAAYWDYQRERIYVKSDGKSRKSSRKPKGIKKILKPDRTIELSGPELCKGCGSNMLYRNGRKTRTIVDLKFMKYGVRRWIVRYMFHRYKCKVCETTFYPELRVFTNGKFGLNIIAYALYQNIELRISQEIVDRSLNSLFGFQLAKGSTNHIKERAARMYEGTYNAIVRELCCGRLLHADETRVSVKGKDGCVWVFTSMEAVAYVYSETREGDLLQTLLKDFKGVLVSDFYAAYDGIPCPQQKCLIHLIRDMNDEVLKHAYDDELKQLVMEFVNLVKPMVETVDRYGLKARFLRKHQRLVDRFYIHLAHTSPHGEVTTKLIDRLKRNRNTLFTFLGFDGVPWNNNNAEHAVKAFAMLRHVIGGVTSEKGIRDYLVLLSICETCKYKGLNFLDFMRSGEKDISTFAIKMPGKQRNR